MAYATSPSNVVRSNGSTGNANGIPADKQADGFINVDVKAADGSWIRLAKNGLALRKADGPQYAELIEWLEADPTRVQSLANGGVRLTYVKPGTGKRFALIVTPEQSSDAPAAE